MKHLLIEPTDVLFCRDAIPMAAGTGRGAGCRMPFPSTLHEAMRASLLKHTNKEVHEKSLRGRRGRPISTHAFNSLRVAGPFAWSREHKVLLTVPLDVVLHEDKRSGAKRLHKLDLLVQPDRPSAAAAAGSLQPACVPVATTPPDKNGALHGWWNVAQYRDYLAGKSDALEPLKTEQLWQPEYRIGVQIDPLNFSAVGGQLFAGTYMRMNEHARLYFDAELAGVADAARAEREALQSLEWLLLGGERRLSRMHSEENDPLALLRQAPKIKEAGGPVLLKWVLATPALFAHGHIPGWCAHPEKNPDGLPVGRVRLSQSRKRKRQGGSDLPGRAALVSWCLGKPQTVSGWDTMEQRAKPTQLAVPAGSVYYFVCENADTANALAAKLHWRPRSDNYGEKGCGYGLCSFDVKLHPASPDIRSLCARVFKH
jgi:CRISPR type III-B/RAMP module-associated protein Cmr3